MQNVMNNILQSVDDLSVVKISNRICSQDNEKHLHQTEKIAKMIDSHIMTQEEIDYIEDKLPEETKTPGSINVINDHNINNFEGHNWVKNESQSWIPPLPPETHKITKMQSNHSDINNDKQSDSGANRIVTDDLSILDKVTTIDPFPMG